MHKKKSTTKNHLKLLALCGVAVFGTAFFYCTNSVAINISNALITVDVAPSCSLERTVGSGIYESSLLNGSSVVVPGSTFTAYCNDSSGYSIYAVGYTDNRTGNTDLVFNNNSSSDYNIRTDGESSNWRMKIAGLSNIGIAPDVENGFDVFHLVPAVQTKIATLNTVTDAANTDTAEGSSIEVTYQATASSTQPAGTYIGQVKYTLVHPQAAVPTIGINDIESMQDFATLSSTDKTAVLASMVQDNQYQLVDNRDGKVYYVARLGDGNVWMTQNLDHDIRTDIDFYTHSNTDLGYGGIVNTNAKWSANQATRECLNIGSDENEYIYNCILDPEEEPLFIDPTAYSPTSADPGSLCWNGEIDDSWSYNHRPNNFSTYRCNQDGSHYHLGNYYNWTAAIAMNDSSDYNTEGIIVDQSICPAGWTLPSLQNFNDLISNLGLRIGISGNIQFSPVFFPYSGLVYYYSDDYYSLWEFYVSALGSWWSNNVGSDWTGAPAAGAMYVQVPGYDDGASVSPIALDRSAGGSIRCILRQ